MTGCVNNNLVRCGSSNAKTSCNTKTEKTVT